MPRDPQQPTYRRPFRAAPVKLGNVYRMKQRHSRLSRRIRTTGMLAAVALAVFGGGMVATNWTSVRAAIGGNAAGAIHFSECGMIRRNCVIDGDTFWLQDRKVRIADIDTPEISEPKCPAEYERGMQAKHRLRDLLNAGPIELQPIPGRDKDGYGRELRVVVLDGRSIGDQLVSEGLARTWTVRREPWC